MKIKDYVSLFPRKSIGYKQMAEKIGCAEITIKKWSQGTRFPPKEYWKRISDATDGKVTVYDLIEATENYQKAQTNQAAHD